MATEQVGVQSMQVTFYGAHSIDFDVRGVGGTGKIDKNIFSPVSCRAHAKPP